MIETKFNKGDIVYIADCEYSETFLGCPDCLGTLKWTIVFADGKAVEVSCQTCKKGWDGPQGRIGVPEYKPVVKKMTIGAVKYDDTSKNPFSYMCEETGVGSGRIYYEENVFANREDAESKASEEYKHRMQNLAQNNFSKKFGGTKKLEDALSSWGFSREQAVKEARLFRKWAKISGIIN